MDEIPEPVVLPCGCFIRPEIKRGVNTLIVSPCKPACSYLADMITTARDAGKRVNYSEAP